MKYEHVGNKSHSKPWFQLGNAAINLVTKNKNIAIRSMLDTLVVKYLARTEHLIKRQTDKELSMKNSLCHYGHYKDQDWI